MSDGVGRSDALDAVALARELHRAALAGADPRAATARAVASLAIAAEDPVIVIATGKAGVAMAEATIDALAPRAVHAVSGLVVTTEGLATRALPTVAGDHPVPGPNSAAASAALASLVRQAPSAATVIVLVSGGTSSLIGAPIEGVDAGDLARLVDLLLASGADIGTMNAIRKRFLRWGAGRLAAALAHTRAVHCLVLSDVPGDDPATIGCGPCAPDTLRAADVLALLRARGLASRLAPALLAHLERVQQGALPETPKPGDAAFARAQVRVVSSNAHAIAAAVDRARALGATVDLGAPLEGEARRCGERLAWELLALHREPRERVHVRLWGGEATVTLAARDGVGGRCQELALAAACALDRAAFPPESIVLLAAGTDGRDGPTDAAGALVHAGTLAAITAAGVDAVGALERHDAYPALDAARALLHTGPTGTNVMDVAIGVVTPH